MAEEQKSKMGTWIIAVVLFVLAAWMYFRR
jgi:hypothetical protein